MLDALARLATGYAAECVRVRQDLSIAESQLRDYQARLGQPFPHEAYLSELAGRIKALKAANTIKATPQRVQRKQAAAAEETITARIRRCKRKPLNCSRRKRIHPQAMPRTAGRR